MIATRKTQRVLFYLAVLFLLVLGAAAIAAPWVAPYKPTEQFLTKRFQAPGMENLLGTDNFGRDVLSRIIYGSQSALLVGIVTVSLEIGRASCRGRV